MARHIQLLRLSTCLVLLATPGPADAALPKPACLERTIPASLDPGWAIEKIARDGSTMIGRTNFGVPVVWRKSESGAFIPEFFPFPPNATSINLEGVSNEGRVIVGSGSFGEPFAQAFRWSEATGIEVLNTGHNLQSFALDVSADGTKIIGRYGRPLNQDLMCFYPPRDQSFLWTGGGFSELGASPPRNLLPDAELPAGLTAVGFESRVYAFASEISGDGQSIVGVSYEDQYTIAEEPGFPNSCWSDGLTIEAAFWGGGGNASPLGVLGVDCSPPFPSQPAPVPVSQASHVSHDGNVILGHVGVDGPFDPSQDQCRAQQAKWLGGSGPIRVFDQPTTQISSAVTEDGTAILATRKGENNVTRVWVFEDSPVPRLLDEVLTEDFCVDLRRTIIGIVDITNLKGGGVVAFVGQSNPPFGPSGLQYVVLPCRDPDEDGLCSEWEEMGGIDFDGDGKITSPSVGGADLVLKDADPMHKDIYVEIDELLISTVVKPGALEDIKNAFARVPNALIGNPDGNPGIALHFESDEIDLELPGGRTNWSTDDFACSMPSDVFLLRSSHFGTKDERKHPDIVDAKAGFYRYLLFGGIGQCQAEPFGNDILVALGNLPQDGTREDQSTVIMHELGHSFGLRHGGVQHENHKPNYHSIMNYTWEFRSRETIDSTMGQQAYANSWVLDYSRRPFRSLLEPALQELNGIGGNILHWVAAGPLRPCFPVSARLCARLVSEGSTVDWNENGVIDSELVGPVNVNETRPGAGNTTADALLGAGDWPTVADLYEDLRHPNWRGGVGSDSCLNFSDTVEEGEAGLVELTPEEVDELVSQPLAIDCNENGTVDDDELAAGDETDLNDNGVLDSCEPMPGDIDLDEDVDEDDRQLLITSFGRGEGEDEYLELADLDLDRTVTFVDYQSWIETSSRQAAGIGEATVRFEPSLATVPLGEDVLVEIVGDLGSPVLGFGLDLAFDPTVVGVVGDPEIGPVWQTAFATDGDRLVGIGPTSGVSGSSVLLARVTLRALRPGLSELVASITDDDLAEGLPLEGSGFAAVTFETGQVRVPEPGLVGLFATLLLLQSIRVRVDGRHISDSSSRETPIETLYSLSSAPTSRGSWNMRNVGAGGASPGSHFSPIPYTRYASQVGCALRFMSRAAAHAGYAAQRVS